MSPKNAPKPTPKIMMGMVNYYVPSPDPDRMDKKIVSFLTKAGRDIPRRMRRMGARWDGSFWIFNSALYPDVKLISDEFAGHHNIRFNILEEFTVRNPEQIFAIVKESLQRSIEEIVPSLQSSVAGIKGKLDDLLIEDADTMLNDRLRDARAKLEDISIVVASFAFTEHFDEIRNAVTKTIETERQAAESVIAKESAKRLKEMAK